jgi:hypothetical protein
MAIYRLLHQSMFEPADIEAMAEAFEAACFALNVSKQGDVLRDLVAALVIDCAQTGERDPGRLCEFVVFSFNQRFRCA